MEAVPNRIIRLDCNLLEESMETAGVHSFRKLRDALDYISGQAGAAELFIEPGVYWLDDPDGQEIWRAETGETVPYGITVQIPKLTITGCGSAEEVVLAANRGQSHGAVGNYTIFRFLCDSLTLRNVTLGNYCSVDLVYPADVTQNQKRRTAAVTQAQIGEMNGDKFFAENCRFVGRLNLNPVIGAARSLYHACHFESTDDALNGNAVYVKCDFDFYGRRPLYATGGLGAVFLGCEFTYHAGTEDEQKAYFTKMGGPVVVVDGTFTCAEGLKLCWAGCPQNGQVCYQSNVKKNGRTDVIGTDKQEEEAVLLNDTVLRAFRFVREEKVIYNTYNLLAGADAWDPMNCKEAAALQQADRLPVGLAVRLSDSVLSGAEDESVTMQVAHRYAGGDLEPVSVLVHSEASETEEPFVTITAQENGSLRIVSKYVGAEEKKVRLKVVSEYGLVAVAELVCLPRLKTAPRFAREPVLEQVSGALRMDYELQTEARGEKTKQDESSEWIAEQDDTSEIFWYRCADKAGSEDILVAVTRYRTGKQDVPMREYRLSEADIGYFIKAEILPGAKGCERSACGAALYSEQIGYSDVEETTEGFELCTDFVHFPLVRQPRMRRGFWTVDSYRPENTAAFETWYGDEHCVMPWVYGGFGNNSTEYGIYQGVQGTRLCYTPVRENFSAMSLRLVAMPAKTLGQGFGSAGQYMDVLIHAGSECAASHKEDIASSGSKRGHMIGYGLRIMRKAEASDVCYFMLVRYAAGVAEILSEQIPASCYRGDCTIALKTIPAGDNSNNMQLRVDVTTDAEPLSGHKQKGYAQEIHLKARINGCEHMQYGLAIVHTGTTGAGGWQNATMLKRLEARWE